MRPSELMQACYDLLTVSSVTSLLSASYGVPAVFQAGRVPRNDAGDAQYFPYITYSLPSDADFSDKLDLGGTAIVQVDVWDRSGSGLSLADTAMVADSVTTRQEWNVPGFITCERESFETFADPDGLTMHGIIRLRVTYLE